jgi:chromosome segregation ATPase
MFVFGRRAQQLRHRKISDLIHFSAEHPNETYASVEIFLRFIERTDDFKVN